jgi:hypothetical protein
VDDSHETGLKQPDSCKCSARRRFPLRWNRNSPEQVLVITMVLSFAIDDHIEGGVIAAVILLNIVVG